MKNLTILFASILLLGMLSGCKKDDSSSNNSTPGFSVKIDGTLWNAPVYSAYYDEAQNFTVISTSTTDVTKQLQIGFAGHTTGTYHITETDFHTYGSYMDATAQNLWTTFGTTQASGEIVISEYNTSSKTISGTFVFTAYDMEDMQKTFTEGKFTKIPYTEQ